MTKIPVRVLEHTSQDMLMGGGIPHFGNFWIKELEEESREKEEEPTPPVPTETEAGMVMTHAR